MSGWVRYGCLALALLCTQAGCTDEPLVPAPGKTEPRRLSDPPRVLLIGDSILDQHGSHARVALRNMGLDATAHGVWGSSLFTRNQYDCGAVQVRPQNDAFAWLQKASQLVERVDPDLVFVYLNHNYLPPYPRTAEQCQTPEDDFIELGSPEFVEMTGRLLQEFLRRLRLHAARVVFVSPLPMDERPARENVIFNAYLTFQEELDFDVVDVSAQLTSNTGGRLLTAPDCDGFERRVRPERDNHLTYFGAGLMGSALARAVARELGVADNGISAPAERPSAVLAAGDGYRVVTCDAATFAFGEGVVNAGGGAFAAARPSGKPAVAAAGTESGAGYLLLFSSGQVLSFGDAPNFGSAGADVLAGANASGIALAPGGRGYWIASSRGAVHAFGGAPILGGLPLANDAVVGMAALRANAGYWLVTSSGQVGAFGAARHFGDLAGASLSHSIAGIAAHPEGNGYWLLDQAGRVFPFGEARDHGSAYQVGLARLIDYHRELNEPVASTATALGITATPSGSGYHVVLDNGALCHFGDAARRGSLYRTAINGMLIFGREPRYPAGSPCE